MTARLVRREEVRRRPVERRCAAARWILVRPGGRGDRCNGRDNRHGDGDGVGLHRLDRRDIGWWRKRRCVDDGRRGLRRRLLRSRLDPGDGGLRGRHDLLDHVPVVAGAPDADVDVDVARHADDDWHDGLRGDLRDCMRRDRCGRDGNTIRIISGCIRSITGRRRSGVGRGCRRLRGLRDPRCSRRHSRRGRTRRDGGCRCVRRRNGRYRVWYHRLNRRYHRGFRHNRRRDRDGRQRRGHGGDDCGGVGRRRRRVVRPGRSRTHRQCRRDDAAEGDTGTERVTGHESKEGSTPLPCAAFEKLFQNVFHLSRARHSIDVWLRTGCGRRRNGWS
jgi:hypothetical protein